LEPLSLSPGRFFRLACGFYLLLALAGGLWIGLREGPIPVGLFIDARTWPADLALGIGGGGLLLLLWAGARRTSRLARELEERLAAVVGPLAGAEVFALALISGLTEELFFRGAILRAWGSLPATLLFALLHTGPGRVYRTWTLFAVLAGAGFSALVLWRGNLLPAIAAHALVNAVNLRLLVKRFRDRLPPSMSDDPGASPDGP